MKPSSLKIVLTLNQIELSSLKKEDIEGVDYLEIRFDLLTKRFIEKKLFQRLIFLKKPVIFTLRKSKDSSLKQVEKIPDQIILQILEKFTSKENFLDIEMDSKSIFSNFINSKFSYIYSFHDFKKSISFKKMQTLILKNQDPAKEQIFKFAVTPKTMNELALFLINIQKLSKSFNIAGIAMGELGTVSRIFGDKFGSTLTYCCLKDPKAPGQITLKAMKLFRNL